VIQGLVPDFAWSPTGDQIAFTHSEADTWSASELRVIDLATGTVTPLAGMGESDLLSVIEFSPEGDRILFSRTTDLAGKEDRGNQVSSLWSIAADGSDLRHLVAGSSWGDWQSLGRTS
jgi:Tol biopolymer transport system component